MILDGIKKPKLGTRSKSDAGYKREIEIYETAKHNHKFNEDNASAIQSWENYDKAISLMERTPEGKAVLEKLREEGVIYEVAINTKHRDTVLKDAADGCVEFATWEGGKPLFVMLLSPATMRMSTSRVNGAIDFDSEPLATVWHEGYHGYERSPMNADPSNLGTISPHESIISSTRLINHEKPATRFENIIRGRLGGKLKKEWYAAGTRRAAKVPDPLGTGPYSKEVPNEIK